MTIPLQNSLESLSDILQKPLIVGASVSANHLADSPGKIAALKFTSPREIKIVAGNGKRGRDAIHQLNAEALRDRTIILGVDLFFWDSFLQSPEPSINAIERFVELAKKNKIPIVIGDIPVLVPHLQPSATALNAALKRACAAYPLCYTLSLSDLLGRALSEGHVEFKGRRYSLEVLVPDGLHTGRPANEYLAEEIEKLLTVRAASKRCV